MLELDFCVQLGEMLLQIEVSLPARQITAITGVSGSGKTSLINVVAGLIRPEQGRVVLNDRVLVDGGRRIFIPPERRHIGYVFQDARLFPHYRVRGNLQYAIAATMRMKFDAIVALLGLEALLYRYPATLSGGEKQRVAIARALLTAPDLLLMDEPLASLDQSRKQEVLPYLKKLSNEVNIPILYVTHDRAEIAALASHLLVLEGGKVSQYGALCY